jgi:nucleotide-binding universal stress UspA family protein
MKEDRRRIQGELHDRATRLAQEHGVQATSVILEGREVQAILRFLKEQKADLLIIGLRQHDFYLSRLWNSVYDLAQDATCSVLGVH